MLDAILPLMTLQMAHYHAAGLAPDPGEAALKAALSGGLACYGVYRCADGKYIALGILEEKFWKSFCVMVGRPEWINQQFVIGEDAERLQAAIAALFKTRTRGEWVAAAKEYDTCLTPVLEIGEIETDPQVKARNMIIEQTHPVCGKIKGMGVPLKFSKTPAKPAGTAPSLGKDTAAIMEEIGYKPEEIKALRKEGIILIAED
jgi:crotonobetainyl-CoA:carnitine CoA-transferase CaiB-like acyl-CoA transferase